MLLDRFFSQTTDGVFAVDQEGCVVYWNPSVHALLGYSEKEVLGVPCHQVLKGMDVTGQPVCKRRCVVAESLRNRHRVHSYDMSVRHKDGTRLWVNVGILFPDTRVTGEKIDIHVLRPLHINQLLERLALLGAAAASAPEQVPALTKREREVLTFMAAGLTASAAARRLGLSPDTVRTHMKNILAKLGVHSKAEAVACAYRHRLIPDPKSAAFPAPRG